MITMKFYVYIYLRRDGSPYYVGKGCNGRWKRKHRVEVPHPDRVIFLITETTEEWAHFIEMEFIDQHGRLNDGTGILENWTDGGEGLVGIVRKPMSEEHRRKLSEANKGKPAHNKGKPAHNKGKPMSEATKRKIAAANKGKLKSTETRRRLSDAWKSRGPVSDETKQKISAAKKGKKITEEHKHKIGEASKGRTHTKEAKQKMSEIKRGKPRSEETKRKISETLRARRSANAHSHAR